VRFVGRLRSVGLSIAEGSNGIISKLLRRVAFIFYDAQVIHLGLGVKTSAISNSGSGPVVGGGLLVECL